MCIRDRVPAGEERGAGDDLRPEPCRDRTLPGRYARGAPAPVSYTHLRAHETVLDLVCRLLLETKKIMYTTRQRERTPAPQHIRAATYHPTYALNMSQYMM